MSDVQMKRRWKERRKKIADEFFAGDGAVADAVLDALPYSAIPDWDDVAAIVRALDAAGLLVTPAHDAEVTVKALRDAQALIKGRREHMARYDAPVPYQCALSDAWGLIANRIREIECEGGTDG